MNQQRCCLCKVFTLYLTNPIKITKLQQKTNREFVLSYKPQLNVKMKCFVVSFQKQIGYNRSRSSCSCPNN